LLYIEQTKFNDDGVSGGGGDDDEPIT